MQRKTTILTITGSDSTGGTGIQADIKTMAALGAYATTAITTVTVQDRAGIRQFYDIPAEMLEKQVATVMDDMHPDAVKIGMLRTTAQVEAVARLLERCDSVVVIIDMVVISSRGTMLMDEEVIDEMQRRLFPLSTVVTIKQDCACRMTGMSPAKNNHELEQAARRLLAQGPQAVVLQGGAIASETFTDVLVEASEATPHFYTRPGFIDRNTHGAAGAFAAALAVQLCGPQPLTEAVEHAQAYLAQLVLRSINSSSGHGTQLLDHGHGMAQATLSPRMLEIYNLFMDNIATNHRTTSEVGFYAQQLSVTPRYLALVTRRVAGRSPKQLIDDYIIKEVDVELLDTAKNIQEIAFGFGFASQAQFNKFFRKMHNTSPGAFRRANG